MGGDPTGYARTLTLIGTASADGLVTRTEVQVDLASGRFFRVERGAIRNSRVVFDGRTLWQRDWTGGVHPLDGVDASMGAVTEAYLRRYGYLHPGRDPATFGCVSGGAGADAQYDIVSIVPQGGREVRMWVDRGSGLPAKTWQRTATSTATALYDDYRQVGQFALPFVVRSTEGSGSSTFAIQSVTFTQGMLPRPAFARPATLHDGSIIDGARSTIVPMIVEGGQALVEVEVNGRHLLFQLDTGGHAILTREAARALGVHLFGSGASGGGGEGTVAEQYTRPQTLQIGGARIGALPFYVIPYGRDFWDRGPGRAPRAGILGLEIFERFAVRLDYASGHLTLTPLQRFAYRGAGARLALTFEADTPLVPARADDVPGHFQLDTGNSGGTLIFGPFLRAHHLNSRYTTGFKATSSGTGGEVHLQTRRLRRLAVDGLLLERFVSYFVDQRTGAFSSRTEAGNLGFDVLSQFTTTLDYLHRVAYVEPLAVPRIPVYNRVGLYATPDGGALVVRVVFPNSPASLAGIVPNDQLLQVNGRAGSGISVDAFRALTRGAIGSTMVLDVMHRARRRHVILHLRELLCPSPHEMCSPAVRRIHN